MTALVGLQNAIFDALSSRGPRPKPLPRVLPYPQALQQLQALEARYVRAPAGQPIPVDQFQVLLAHVPSAKAREFLARSPDSPLTRGSAHDPDGSVTREWGPELELSTRWLPAPAPVPSSVAQLRDLYLAHFAPYFEQEAPDVVQRTLSAMAYFWRHTDAVDGIREFAERLAAAPPQRP